MEYVPGSGCLLISYLYCTVTDNCHYCPLPLFKFIVTNNYWVCWGLELVGFVRSAWEP